MPADLAESVGRYAVEHKTSTNDALVRLAYAGAEAYDREREIAELAAVRREAIFRPTPTPPGTRMPSAEETAEAILAFRLGLLDEEEWGA